MHSSHDRIAGTVACALALSVYFGGVRANENLGTLTGKVFDNSIARPIAGVVVTATSPQLIGKQVVTTDATGTYWLPQLPPGVYALRFEKEKYGIESCPDISLNADQTLRINTALNPENFHPYVASEPCPRFGEP